MMLSFPPSKKWEAERERLFAVEILAEGMGRPSPRWHAFEVLCGGNGLLGERGRAMDGTGGRLDGQGMEMGVIHQTGGWRTGFPGGVTPQAKNIFSKRIRTWEPEPPVRTGDRTRYLPEAYRPDSQVPPARIGYAESEEGWMPPGGGTTFITTQGTAPCIHQASMPPC